MHEERKDARGDAARSRHAGVLNAALTIGQTAAEFGVSVRKFRDMRRRGLVPPPIVLGPRTVRWVRSDLEAFLAAMPRQQECQSEPMQLARARIERMKATGSATAE